jgi:hypothetical protein
VRISRLEKLLADTAAKGNPFSIESDLVRNQFIEGVACIPECEDIRSDEREYLADKYDQIISLIRAKKKKATITVELLDQELASYSDGEAGEDQKEQLQWNRKILERTCEWFCTDAFQEMHPLEQAVLVLLRMMDIEFQVYSPISIALLMASLYTMRAGLPPVIVSSEKAERFLEAVQNGRGMETLTLLEVMSEIMEDTVNRIR